MKKEETINLDDIWIDVVKAIDNIKNNDSEKAKQLIESINEINMALKSGERDRIMYTTFSFALDSQRSSLLRTPASTE